MKTTNDMKKGTLILLRNGFDAVLTDSKRGNIRMARVNGSFTEVGSIYAHDIVGYKDVESASWKRDILYTEAQLDLRAKVRSLS